MLLNGWKLEICLNCLYSPIGMVQTFQRGDIKPFGKSYKVTPVTNEKVQNVQSCFLVNGTENATISMQSILPNTTGFIVRHCSLLCASFAFINLLSYVKHVTIQDISMYYCANVYFIFVTKMVLIQANFHVYPVELASNMMYACYIQYRFN